MPVKCKGCGKEIIFISTKNGKQIPCNPERLTIVTEAGGIAQGYTSHFATCPAAEQFRKG